MPSAHDTSELRTQKRVKRTLRTQDDEHRTLYFPFCMLIPHSAAASFALPWPGCGSSQPLHKT